MQLMFVKCFADMQEVMTSLQQARQYLHDGNDKAELGRVLHFLTNERFQRVLKLHNKLVTVSVQAPARADDPSSAVTSLCDLVLQSAATNASRSNNKHASELAKILTDAHFRVSKQL